MRLRILYFATIRDAADEREATLDLPEGSQLSDLKLCLGKDNLRLATALDSAIFAINREHAFDDPVLNDGDEVAIFPPVSGGSDTHPTIVRSSYEPLDLNSLLSTLRGPTTEAACALSSVGLRELALNLSPGSSDTATLSIEKRMKQIADQIRARWTSIEGLAVIEHCSHDEPEKRGYSIVCTSSNRDEGVYEASKFGLDLLTSISVGPGMEIDPG
jgi:molybdopterin synthase catalytic subunit